MSMILTANARRWHGLMLGIVIVITMQLTAAPNVGRIAEPWPALLSSEPASLDPDVVLLQQRAVGSLEKLVQSASAAAQPL